MSRIKIADLLQLGVPVTVSEDKEIWVRGLNLAEMIALLMKEQEAFLALYAQGVAGKLDNPDLTPFLVASPHLVAKIIALATDEPGTEDTIEKCLPFPVQLIALQEIWKISVPDAKKAEELLSVVMALLQKLSEKGLQVRAELRQQNTSPEISVKP